MKTNVKKGKTSHTEYIWIQDSSSTTGDGLSGLAFNSASLTAYYVRSLGSATQITLATQTVTGAWSSGGFVEIDATNMKGLYRLDVPDAVLASGAEKAIIFLKGATNMAPVALEIDLVSYDPQDSVRLGLTAMPNAAAGANGGLPLSVDSSGRVDVLKVNGTSQTARDIGASVLLSSGTGTGQISLSSGTVTVGTNNDKTGYGLSSAAIQAIWDALTSALTTVGSIGKLLVDNINATISSRLASASYTAPLDAAGTRSAIGLASANLDTQLTAIDDYIDTEVSAIKAKTDNLPSDPADASDIAASFSTVNSTLAAIAGYIDTEVSAIKAKTDNLPASPAATGDIPTAAQNATAVLTTQMTESYAADGVAPTLAQALFLTMQSVNEMTISGTTVTVKKLDGTTTAATFTLDDDTEPTSRTRAS